MSPDIPYSPNQNSLENLKPGNILQRFINWAKGSKKRLFIAIGILILIIPVLIVGWSQVKNRFFPTSNIPSIFNQSPPQSVYASTLQIKSPKSSYAQTETIPVLIIASSNNEEVTGFDIAIEYDSKFLTLSKESTPTLEDFEYYNKNGDNIIRISAVKKIGSNTKQILKETQLASLEFTPKQKGKTALKVIYMPGSTADSNLINTSSKDILNTAKGIEVTIQ